MVRIWLGLGYFSVTEGENAGYIIWWGITRFSLRRFGWTATIDNCGGASSRSLYNPNH